MNTFARTIAGMLAGCALAGTSLADDVLRDPFQPPPDLAEPLAAGPGTADMNEVRLGIRAILFAGDRSLVNFGGRILAIGEAANGHELIEVGENYAVFQHGDDVVTLSLNEEPNNEPNPP